MIPEFARVEIAMKDRKALPGIANKLRSLADDIDSAASSSTDETALIVAYHKIKAASHRLRMGVGHAG